MFGGFGVLSFVVTLRYVLLEWCVCCRNLCCCAVFWGALRSESLFVFVFFACSCVSSVSFFMAVLYA